MKASYDPHGPGKARRPLRVSLVCTAALLLTCSLAAAGFVDLSGWWTLDDGEYFEFRQQGSDLTVWSIFGSPEPEIPPGIVSNDTLFFPLGEDTLVFVYANDTLRGNDPGGNPVAFVRLPAGPPWAMIHCGTITVDGLKNDWPVDFIVADDLNNDATGGPWTEIDRLYMCHDDTCLYVCLELVNDASFPDANDRYPIEFKGEMREYSLTFWPYDELRFRDNQSGQETSLWGRSAISGKILEARMPLSLLNGLDRFYVYGASEYWHSDEDRGFYDEILQLAMLGSCACGDVDGSGSTDVVDIISLFDWMFHDGPAPQEMERADMDCNGRLNLVDIARVIRLVFHGGPCESCAE